MLDVISFNPYLLDSPYESNENAPDKTSRVLHQFDHITSAISASHEWDEDDGDEATGVPAPLLTGPFSRSGAERKPIPRDDPDESAA